MACTLETLVFENTYVTLPEDYYCRVSPTPLRGARLVAFNAAAGDLLDLDPSEAERPDFVSYFNGEKQLPRAEPIATLYAGHQFGVYVPQLGDGRALLLGEVRNARGEKWDVQLKGSGRTPYSRMGDGRAVLRSTIREYLCSEAMHGLGVPTTRALCVIGSDEPVYRETIERGALLVRLAPTHVRFGSFEVFFYRRRPADVERLASYVIGQHFTDLQALDRDAQLAAFLQEVTARTARLVAQWQALGFAHGVLNTDNMSILGLTLDYGPFGFLDDYDPQFICNHSDVTGRYAFDQQPGIALWNLRCLAQTFAPLLPRERLMAVLETFRELFFDEYERLMFAKLGLAHPAAEDTELLADWLELLARNRADYTIAFRRLSETVPEAPEHPANARLQDAFVDRDAVAAWLARYGARLAKDGLPTAERQARMRQVNPKYILRNYLAQVAIERAQDGDFTEIERLLAVLRRPYDEQPEWARYAEPPPAWGKRLEVSCSS
ncbi:MAG: protein adenylyltransferase SelO [Chloracidobacterium sp.]|uniref:Protein nucleotidyltransferase YdiU n=1 Tax=Chloracidobacterium validum TaxID=2821543 RepID=A0ABX8BFN0_9BACT|nr:YdiU family protein [Chloracidobacterium validum]QUW04735.1 YdiU family protein [Chloracidobacterium validum]